MLEVHFSQVQHRFFSPNSVGFCMFKVNNRNTKASWEICSKLIIKIPASFWCRLGTYFFAIFFPLLGHKHFTYTLFLICNTFITNARLKLAKTQANAKQHPDAEQLLFENYSHSSSTLSSKNNRAYSMK